MPYRQIAQDIVADWCATERDLEAAGDTSERARLQAEMERLRQEYNRLLDEAARSMQHDLPPMPHSSETAST